MRYLYIDTSSSYLYAAIVEDTKEISCISEEFGQSLSEIALPRIAEMFEKNNLSTKSVDKIIVVNGPGSFTGIRIGITIAKIYAWSLNIPITTITSLDAMACSCTSKRTKIPMLNARRGYVYTAIYDENNNILFNPCHIKLSEFKKEMFKYNDYIIISNDEFEEEFEKIGYVPDYVTIISKFKDKDNINPHAINPDYLKLTEAEESKL